MIQLQSMQQITIQREVFFPGVFVKDPIKSAEWLSKYLEYDARLVRKCVGYFYLYISKRCGKYNGLLQNMDAAFNPGGRNAFVLDIIQIVLLNIRKSDISGIHTLLCYRQVAE